MTAAFQPACSLFVVFFMSYDDETATPTTDDDFDYAALDSPTGWDFLALQERVESTLPTLLTPIPLSCESQIQEKKEEGESVVYHVITSTCVRAFGSGKARVIDSFPMHISPINLSFALPR